jgi:transposase
MQWPAMSPDMNPIEHIWDMLGRDVRRHHAPQTILQLTNALIVEWNNLPNSLVQRSSILCVDALAHYLEPEVTRADIELNEKIACILKLLMKLLKPFCT